MNDILEIKAGSRALERVRQEGLPQSSVDVMLGASGGPKWFVLSGLDKALISEYYRDRDRPLHLLGTSAGSWRFSCYAQQDALSAHERFEQGYLLTRYSDDPTPEEITEKCQLLVDEMIPHSSAEEIINHPVMRFNLIAVRSRGLAKSDRKWPLLAGMGLAAASNVVSRKTLGRYFTRILFHSGTEKAPFHSMNNLPTERIELTAENVADAVLASGSIPMVMQGVSGIAGAPEGVYRDGGVTDYHFDMEFPKSEGLILYPHFYSHMVPGWFDKGLKWRKPARENCDNLVLVAPSKAFVEKLPYGKIPDRKDFTQLSYEDRVKYWKAVIKESERLGETFLELVESGKIRQAVTAL